MVITDLAALRGPAGGAVVLPLRLYWSPPGRSWDLGDPEMAAAMYEHVLGQAAREEELGAWLNAARLAELWPRLFLPKGVRRAWEERHPSLRASAATA